MTHSPFPPTHLPPPPPWPGSPRRARAAPRCPKAPRTPAADCVAPPACGSGPRAAYTHTPPLCPLQLPRPPVQSVALAPSQLALARLQLVSREVQQPCPEGAGVVPQFQDHAHEGIVLRPHSRLHTSTQRAQRSEGLKARQAVVAAHLLTPRLLVEGVLDGVQRRMVHGNQPPDVHFYASEAWIESTGQVRLEEGGDEARGQAAQPGERVDEEAGRECWLLFRSVADLFDERRGRRGSAQKVVHELCILVEHAEKGEASVHPHPNENRTARSSTYRPRTAPSTACTARRDPGDSSTPASKEQCVGTHEPVVQLPSTRNTHEMQ